MGMHRRAVILGLSLVATSSLVQAGLQDRGAAPPRRPDSRPCLRTSRPVCLWARAAPPGTAIAGPIMTPEGHGPEGPAALDPRTQVVRFQGPSGLGVEVLAPAATPVPIGDGGGIATVGLDRGVGYRLRLTNITERPGVELFPVIEVVGHLHRPTEIDPAKYPDPRRLHR